MFSRLDTISACDRQTERHTTTAKTTLMHSVTRVKIRSHHKFCWQPVIQNDLQL